MERTVTLLVTRAGRCLFDEWYRGIRDRRARQLIAAKLSRLEEGEFDNFKALGAGVYELRIYSGPGYRIYFGLIGNELVVLLGGGDKDTQRDDIAQAKALWKEYKNAFDGSA